MTDDEHSTTNDDRCTAPADGERIPCQFPCPRDECTGTLEFDADDGAWAHVEPEQRWTDDTDDAGDRR